MMTLFARYYKQRALVQISMDEMEILIKDEKNKEIIAEHIFHRYYDRYLKIFDYKSNVKLEYKKIDGSTVEKDEFLEEYKNGFAMMTTSCLLIETISAFFEGHNETRRSGSDTFKSVFEKAKVYGNPLQYFISESAFYKNIRCGLLHQGETYGQFKISRKGELYNKANKTINAKLFTDNLRIFLSSYRDELNEENWDSDIWDKCRVKIRHIINNSR